MNIQTKKLLEQCSSGCQMALDSMAQIQDFIKDDKLSSLVQIYQQKHRQLSAETMKLLYESGNEKKEPGMMAQAMSWLTTEMKLLINDDSQQAAKILMDGCNMGIKTISSHIQEYSDAKKSGLFIAKKLVGLEEDMQKDLIKFLQNN